MEVQVLSPAHKTLGPDAEHWGLYVLVVRSDLKDGPSPSVLGLGSRGREYLDFCEERNKKLSNS